METDPIRRARTGDAVFFTRRVLRDIRSWGDLGGYISNGAICAAQWLAGDTDDFGIELIHCGMVWVRREGGTPFLLEYTADKGQTGRSGLRAVDLGHRMKYYGPGAFVVPLRPGIEVFDSDVSFYFHEHKEFNYNWTGLLAACSKWWPGWRSAGARFCSEGLIDMWQECGVLPRTQRNPVGKRLIPVDIEGHKYSPADVARLRRILNWEYAWTV